MTATLWQRLKNFVGGDASSDAVEELERLLLEADFGPQATFDLVDRFEARRKRAEFADDGQLRDVLITELAAQLALPDGSDQINVESRDGPAVIVVLGVNGVGKTTTIAKLAHRLRERSRSVLLAAADTYRAAAVDQLTVWAERLGVDCVAGAPGGDPAAVAYDAIDAAVSRGVEVVIVDTAGRLHTKDDLIEELKKIVRVIAKRQPGAPHETLLVVDATTGQNAIQQAKTFQQAVPITGVVLTKVDGTARGGTAVAIRRECDLPVRFVGTGEQLTDLQPLEPRVFAEQLLDAG